MNSSPKTARFSSPKEICDHCLSPNTAGDGTGCDNMTIIVAQILRSASSTQQLPTPSSS
uniref:Uncharacterized protein n=1 Tax=Loa loa TaxID=7209 RepID=A0A1I7W2A1_LOALO